MQIELTVSRKESIVTFLNSLNLYQFIFIGALCTFTLSVGIGITYRLIEQNLGLFPDITNYYAPVSELPISNVVFEFFSAVVIAPLWETFVYQFLLILVLKFMIKNTKAVVLLSAFFFSLGHFPNGSLSMISTFFTGCFLSYSFLYWQKKTKLRKKGFEASMGIHALHNFYYSILSFVPASIFF